jgi:chromosome segregation ATPase
MASNAKSGISPPDIGVPGTDSKQRNSPPGPGHEASLSSPLGVLQAELAAERSRLTDLEASLRRFDLSNTAMTRQLENIRAQNAELSTRISQCAENRAAAESRLGQTLKDSESVEVQQAALETVRAPRVQKYTKLEVFATKYPRASV